MYKQIKITLFTGFFILTSCKIFSQDTTQYKVGIAYASSLYSNKEKFEFALNGGEKLELNSANPVVYFSQRLSAGQTYSITQLSGPKACNMWGANTGTITNSDVLVNADCGYPPLSIFKLNIIGVGQGETFNFADNYRRTLQIPFSTLANLGGYPRGDYYLIEQTAGPRQCKLTSNEGTVPETNITIQADCRKPAAPLVPPKNKYDLVTRSSDDKILNTYYESWAPVIGGQNEDEGRYVAFGMYGKGIVGSSGNYRQIYWRDRKTGITKLVSKTAAGEEGNGNSAAPAISADGRYVVFESAATNLATNDKNTYLRDVFLWDQQSGQLKLISKAADGSTGNGESYEPVISGDGGTIAYTSNASDIVTLEPVFNAPNIYVCDVGSGRTEFITKDYETGKAGSGYAPSISDDGSRIAFCSYSYRLIKNDNNNLWDIFLWQRGMPGLKRISMTSTGGERNLGDESSSRVVWPSISGDGNNIVFATTSSNINSNDNNGVQDIFLYNIPAGSIKRVSTANGATEGDGDSPIGQGERIGISYDGTWITYNTNATNLGVPKGNIVKQHTQTGEIIPVTSLTIGSTARPMISREGNYVVAGCSESYDKKFSSSGIFVIYTGK
jgi:Tol biopolymer transport system component